MIDIEREKMIFEEQTQHFYGVDFYGLADILQEIIEIHNQGLFEVGRVVTQWFHLSPKVRQSFGMIFLIWRTQKSQVLLLHFNVPILLKIISHIFVQGIQTMHIKIFKFALKGFNLFFSPFAIEQILIAVALSHGLISHNL